MTTDGVVLHRRVRAKIHHQPRLLPVPDDVAPDDGVRRLAQLFYLKYRLGALGLAGVQRVGDHLLLKLRDLKTLEKALKSLDGVDLRVITPRRAHWMLPQPDCSPEQALDYLYESAVACRLPRQRGQSAARPRRS